MSQLFNSKIYVEPAVGVKIVTNVTATPNPLSFGRIAIIGESEGGLTMEDSVVYDSTDAAFFNSVLRSGAMKRSINLMFSPSPDQRGAESIVAVRAQAATKATKAITQSTPVAATLTMTTVDKGVYLSTTTTGLYMKFIAGLVDSAKHQLYLQFNEALLWVSPEVSTFQELIDAIEDDSLASSWITVAMTAGVGSTTIDNTARAASYVIFTGGTSPAMASQDVDDALQLLSTQDFNIIFICSESNVMHAKLLSFVSSTAEYPIMVFCGGAIGETSAQVLVRSLALNSEKVILAYPGVNLPEEEGVDLETVSPMYHAAILAGLAAGMSPEMPLTWKKLKVFGFEYDLSKTERVALINGGVTASRRIPGLGYAVNKGVNTLQNNGSMIFKNTDGSATSPEISIIRIKNQIIKELQLASAPLFLGGTVATVSKQDIINFTKTYLQSKVSTNTQSNLLLSYQDVSATLEDDAWKVYFGFTPNTPINFVFYTGTMLKP